MNAHFRVSPSVSKSTPHCFQHVGHGADHGARRVGGHTLVKLARPIGDKETLDVMVNRALGTLDGFVTTLRCYKPLLAPRVYVHPPAHAGPGVK